MQGTQVSITKIITLVAFVMVALPNSGATFELVPETNFFSAYRPAAPVLSFGETLPQAKSQWAALSYAVFPGYFIPAAFGHAYAEDYVQATVISTSRLAGRIMWFHAFFDNLLVEDRDGAMESTQDRLFFFAGLALDIGGYIYDILHSPVAVAKHNKQPSLMKVAQVRPFLDLIGDTPCCGIQLRF